MKISFFDGPVTNTISDRTLDWEEFCELILNDPIVLLDNDPATKAKYCTYYNRGYSNGPRCDENLEDCYLIILDVDKPIDDAPLPTPAEVNEVFLKADIAFACHSSATPGRCRIILASEAYAKTDAYQKTWEAYCFCKENNLNFVFSGESKKLSQPWFFPQTINPFSHQAYVHKAGYYFDSSYLTQEAPTFQTVQTPKAQIDIIPTNGSKDQNWFIAQVKSGTLHQAAISYSGYLAETTSWTSAQVLEHLTLLVEVHADDKLKDRWERWERKGIEKWYSQQNFLSGKILSNEGKEIISGLKQGDKDKIDCILEKCVSLKELKMKEFAPINWVVKGMLPAGLIIVGGRPKVGKSFFCLDLVDAVATGSKCFGNMETSQGTAIYVSLEDGERRVNKRLNELSMNGNEKSFMLDTCLPVNGGLRRIIRKLKQKHDDLSLIVIDTMTHVILPPSKGTDNYNYYSMTLTSLQHLAAELNITLILMHHLKKGVEGNVFDRFLGSVGFQGAADTMLIIERKVTEEKGFFTVSSRDMGDNIFEMSFEEMKWTYVGEAVLACDNANYITIAEAIKKAPESCLRAKDIIEKTGMIEGTVKTSLKRMLENGLLTKMGRGQYSLKSSSKGLIK